MDSDTRRLDLDSAAFTENTRASYPIPHIPNATRDGMGGHPRNVIFLTADAFGVLPPVAKLTTPQAMFHFLSGYTAKVAGTERGVTEPQPNFSACFGAPFLPLHPTVYDELLGKKLSESGANVWLVNTGWSGGPFGVGSRMKLAYTRAMVGPSWTGACPGSPPLRILSSGSTCPRPAPTSRTRFSSPGRTWEDKGAYDEQARKLAGMFAENFQQFEEHVGEDVKAAGPKV
jgi:phosphoenolpyruvate carboxykinase (ATP)